MNSIRIEDTDNTKHENESSSENRTGSHSNHQYLVTLLIFLAQLSVSSMRMNLSIAIIEMTSTKSITIGNKTITQQPNFNWDSPTKGLIMSVYFYGFLLAPIGGYFDNKFGGTICYGVGMLITCILTILTPFILNLNLYAFIFCRALEGVAEGITNSCEASLWYTYTLPDIRPKLMAFSILGATIGISVCYPISGYIAYHYGWAAIFYATGGISLIWCVMWFWSTSKVLVKLKLKGSTQIKESIPWIEILKCKSTWAICAVKIFQGWGETITIQYLPIYIKDLIQAEIRTIGYLSSIPTTASVVSLLIIGYLMNFIIRRKILTDYQLHKIILFVSLIICSVVMIIIAFESDTNFIVIYVTLFTVFMGWIYLIIPLVTLTIAQQFASTVCGIYTACYIFTMIITPIYVEFTVVEHKLSEWRTCYLFSAFLAFLSNIIYVSFASNKRQPWTESCKTEEINKLKEEKGTND